MIVAASDNETLDQATKIIASLVKRLPLKHKSFTRVPQARRERIAAELKMQEQIRKKTYRAKLLSELVSPLAVAMIIGIVLFFILYLTQPDQIPNEELDKDANDWYYTKQMFMGLIGLAEIVGVICYFENVAKATKNETLL